MVSSPRREHVFVEPSVNSSHYLQLAQSTLLKLRKKKDSSLRIRVLHKELIKNIWKLPAKPVKTSKIPNILRRRGIQKPRARRGVVAKPLSEYIELLEKESALRETSLHHKMLRQVKTINKCKTVTDLLKKSKKLKFECDRLVAQRKDNQESMWSCEKCDRGFKDFSSYNHHMEYHSKVISFMEGMEDSEPKCVEQEEMSSK